MLKSTSRVLGLTTLLLVGCNNTTQSTSNPQNTTLETQSTPAPQMLSSLQIRPRLVQTMNWPPSLRNTLLLGGLT